jgi:hypothetical protein
MATFSVDSFLLFDSLKSTIFSVALCLFIAIGSARLILQELIALIIIYKRFKLVLKSEVPPEGL